MKIALTSCVNGCNEEESGREGQKDSLACQRHMRSTAVFMAQLRQPEDFITLMN